MIVMYHYVRPIADSDYTAIKGRETEEFVEQIAYLARHHRIVPMQTVIAALEGDSEALPENAVVLTFDDGYRDHFSDALPAMRKAGVTGTFFVPECAVTHRRVLDVNKIHFILAKAPSADDLAAEIDRRIADSQLNPAEYRRQYWAANRFDPAAVIYVKRMLQHALPVSIRTPLLDALFRQWVSADEADFAARLYMSEAELKEALAEGMLVGAHGSNHLWLDRCDSATQHTEIDRSAAMLERLGVPASSWTFCYPYGAYNQDTLALLRARGFRCGVTTEVDLVRIPGCDPLLMPRLDTNDLPILGHAEPNNWSRRLAQMAPG
jgi:peptidoglycan/xylan/chitin deacetylase (PgdA/CDA1 family)